MNIILFNMSNYLDWQSGIVNRNFFVVRELIKRPEVEKVILVDFLAIQSIKKIFGKRRTWDYAGQAGIKHRFVEVRDDPFKVGEKQVFLYKGLGFGRSAKRQLAKVAKFAQKQGYTAENTVIWSYNAFLPKSLKMAAKLKVFDTVDNWAEHASYKKEAALLRRNYQAIDRSADIIFTVSDGLRSLFKHTQAKWIPNGVDTEHFVTTTKPNSSKKVVGYIGTIQERIDFDLLEYLCKQHPDKEFRMYGPIWSGAQKETERLRHSCDNVKFLGRIAYQESPKILSEIDVAIIPHRIDAFLQSTNPMKMYEYLAAGKPVVTTPGAGTEMFKEVLSICKDSNQFSEAIDNELRSDNADKAEMRRSVMQNHSWNSRVGRMVSTFIWQNPLIR